MNPQPKDKPFKCRKYRAYIQSLPCVITGRTGAEVVPHHAIGVGLGGTMGGKIGDNYLFPIIQTLHQELHNDPKKWEEKHGKQLHFVDITLKRDDNPLDSFLKFITGLEDG